MPHKRLVLVRRWWQPERTIGELFFGGEPLLFTMEPGESDEAGRVPLGFYFLERHGWDGQARFDRTWALVGQTVAHWREPGFRSAIVLHPGNLDEDTRGCILLGLTLGHSAREPALIAGREAMERLRHIIGDQDAFLTIRRG